MARHVPPRRGSARRTRAQAARRRGHGGPAQGWSGRQRQGQGYERFLMSGQEQRRGYGARDHDPLRQTLNNRAGGRDTKDLRFGMGVSVLRIADPQRRDRLLLLNAFAIVLLTLLGAAGESLGMDRHLKVNPAKHRTHSLFWQGCMPDELIQNMPDAWLRLLVARFHEYLNQHRAFAQTFAVV
jgi:hypothetical protein